MQVGNVKLYNEKGGWGFITPNSGGADILVSKQVLDACGVQSLTAGQEVSFETDDGNLVRVTTWSEVAE